MFFAGVLNKVSVLNATLDILKDVTTSVISTEKEVIIPWRKKLSAAVFFGSLSLLPCSFVLFILFLRTRNQQTGFLDKMIPQQPRSGL